MDSRTAEDFFDHEYRAYAMYTVENRAIPSVVDGFKPAQRKIAFAANKLWRSGNEKPMKVFQLGGQAAALSFFHHGSLDNTIINMTQEFKNSMSIFQGVGQFGSLRSPEAGAPRYVGVKFNDNFRRLYKDFELVTPQYEDGEEIEPKFFLPIIPTVLLNGGSGIAVGFATNILNRHPLDLIDAVVEALTTEGITGELKPWINGFHGDIAPAQGTKGRSWNFVGKYEVKSTTQVEITEIPPSFTYEKYEAYLEGLIEKGVINGYEDSSSDRVRYTLRFPRAGLSALLADDKLEGVLRIQESDTENLTTLDETGKLRIFETPKELVLYFTQLRLSYYEKRKTHLLTSLGRELEVLEAKAKFVKETVEGGLKLANVPKSELVKSLQDLGIKKQEGGYEFLLSMPISSLTKEKYQDLQDRLKEKQTEKENLERTLPLDLYLEDLKELRKQLVSKGWKSTVPPAGGSGGKVPPKRSIVKDWLNDGDKKPKGTDGLDFLFRG